MKNTNLTNSEVNKIMSIITGSGSFIVQCKTHGWNIKIEFIRLNYCLFGIASHLIEMFHNQDKSHDKYIWSNKFCV